MDSRVKRHDWLIVWKMFLLKFSVSDLTEDKQYFRNISI